jgi:hypothetical protein
VAASNNANLQLVGNGLSHGVSGRQAREDGCGSEKEEFATAMVQDVVGHAHLQILSGRGIDADHRKAQNTPLGIYGHQFRVNIFAQRLRE